MKVNITKVRDGLVQLYITKCCLFITIREECSYLIYGIRVFFLSLFLGKDQVKDYCRIVLFTHTA